MVVPGKNGQIYYYIIQILAVWDLFKLTNTNDFFVCPVSTKAEILYVIINLYLLEKRLSWYSYLYASLFLLLQL